MLGFQGAAHVRQAVTHALYSTADVLRLCTRSRGSTFIEKRGGWSFFILTLFALFCRETGDTGIVLHFGRSPHSYLLFFSSLLLFCYSAEISLFGAVLFRLGNASCADLCTCAHLGCLACPDSSDPVTNVVQNKHFDQGSRSPYIRIYILGRPTLQ